MEVHMNLTIPLITGKPIYLQIVNYIKTEIHKGTLSYQQKLPSKRVLADSLNVSQNTIIHAYEVLLDSDYIYTIEKKGYYVSDIKKNSPITYWEEESKTIIPKYDFTTNTIDEDLFPKSIWRSLYRQALSSGDFLKRTPNIGLYQLRVEIATHLFQNRGIHVSPSQIVIGSGVEYLLSLLIPLLPCQIYGIENPGYHKIAEIIHNSNKEIKYLPVDSEGVVPDSTVDLLYATPFSQFPLGIKMSLNRKKEILDFLKTDNNYLIEDDFDVEFRTNTTPITSLFSLNSEKVIFFSSFSRTLASSLRLSYMVLPHKLLSSYQEHYQRYSNTVPTLEQIVLAEFLRKGHYNIHINKLKRVYKQRRKIIEEFFKQQNDFTIISNTSYLHLLVKTKKEYDFDTNLLSIDTLAKYDIDEQNKNIYLFGYSNLKNNDILPALKFFCSCIKGKESL